MRKALLPMVASLALCGAATAALVATNARAEQSGHKPTMVALVTPGEDIERSMAAPRAEGGPPATMSENVMYGVRREQICKELYARKAGELAFLEAKLSLNANQAPLFGRWKQISLDAAKQRETECAAPERPRQAHRLSVVDRLTLEEDLLKKRLSDIQAERPALTALYNSLTPAQKEEFGQGDMHRMAGRMRMMLGMMDRPHPGPGRMDRGPMGGPSEPPPPPAQ
jgi:Spy/CpxP family protein refolding chaperone